MLNQEKPIVELYILTAAAVSLSLTALIIIWMDSLYRLPKKTTEADLEDQSIVGMRFKR